MTNQPSDVQAVIPFLNKHCNEMRDPENYQERMTTGWLRLALTDAGFLQGIFLAACRHLSESHAADEADPTRRHQQELFLQLAVRYKIESVRTLIRTIAQRRVAVDDSTVGNVMMLAFDEVRRRASAGEMVRLRAAGSAAAARRGLAGREQGRSCCKYAHFD